MIDLIVLTDGRDHIFRAIPSAMMFLEGPIARRVIFDDSADPANHERLRRIFADWEVIASPSRSGFGGAINNAWAWLRDNSDSPFVFHLEDDFTFQRAVPLIHLADVLNKTPDLIQLALRRQPWNHDEIAAGGIVEQHPGDYHEVRDHAGRHWLEHRRFFTTNPSLYRRSLTGRGWPQCANSEGHFSIELFEEFPNARCGFWGARESGEWVHHIGTTRHGTGY